ncbi:MAG: hypothetical protein J4N28_01310 [Chloroflexi bacterium]|nr:hypothetical protein [Chloroflexota bacterium]
MALTFDIGDADRPKGHAIVYFVSPTTSEVIATYVLILPIPMDIGKYLPPLLAAQLGGMAGEALGEGMGSFAAPPMPESVESVGFLRELASLRGDDLVSGGSVVLGDPAAAMHETAEAVQEYQRLYRAYADAAGPPPDVPRALDAEGSAAGPADVQRVLYELMTERDRLGELSKLVGAMRFATGGADAALVEETEAGLEALEQLLPEHYWIAKVRAAARDASDAGALLAQVYVDRAYKLADEDFAAVELLEKRITDLTADAPPSQDMRG